MCFFNGIHGGKADPGGALGGRRGTTGPMTAPQPYALFADPLATRLQSATRILVAGAGGGFDVYAGLPLFLALRALGKEVFFANLSFTHLSATTSQQLAPALWRVTHSSTGEPRYFPEGLLARWLFGRGLPDEVFAFEKVGVRPLRAAYQLLVDRLRVDTVMLVDGGTDILMRGDESGLGTPAEDMVSLAAVRHLNVAHKTVSCLGFGIDAFHGVCHAHFLENVAALEQQGGTLGVHSLHLQDPAVAGFRDAVEHAHHHMPDRQSIVNGSILSALEGHFGNHHRTPRTAGSSLFINPLMTLYWHFDLAAVAARSLYLDALEDTASIFDVQAHIEAFRRTATLRQRVSIPV